MRISTKFSVAVHILLCVEVFKDSRKVTSDFIAASVNTNPVVIRKIMGLLRRSGIIEIQAGTGGIKLAREPGAISLLEVCRAADPAKDGSLFAIHEDSAPGCPVGGNIAALLAPPFSAAQDAMEQSLSEKSLADVLSDLRRLRKRGDKAAGPGKA